MSKKIILLTYLTALLVSCAGSARVHDASRWFLSVSVDNDSFPHFNGEGVLVLENNTSEPISVRPGINHSWFELGPGKWLRVCGTPASLGGESIQIDVDAPGKNGDWEVWNTQERIVLEVVSAGDHSLKWRKKEIGL